MRRSTTRKMKSLLYESFAPRDEAPFRLRSGPVRMASATGLLIRIGLSPPFLHRAEAEPRKVTAPARPAPWAGSGNPSARNSHRRFPAKTVLAVSSPISLTLQHRSPSPQSLTLCAHQQPATSWIISRSCSVSSGASRWVSTWVPGISGPEGV